MVELYLYSPICLHGVALKQVDGQLYLYLFNFSCQGGKVAHCSPEYIIFSFKYRVIQNEAPPTG
jgi:hypothetical protein